jgi:exosortase A
MTELARDPAMSSSAAYYRVPGLILLLAAAIVVAYPDSVASMVGIWSTDGFRHSFLIPVIAGYLLWHDRERLVDAPLAPSWAGVVALLATVWLWLVARQALIQVVEHLALLGMLHAAVLAVAGWDAYRKAAFALTYLVLAVPLGVESVPWLMELTAAIAGKGLVLIGMPNLREGMYFTLPGGSFEVAEACSGFRYVYSGLALSSLIAYVTFSSWTRRIAFVLLAVTMFMLINGIRAMLVMAIASASEMRYLAEDHVWFGWLLFFVALIGLHFAAVRFSDVR